MEALVDEIVVNHGVAHLDRALQVLGHQHVLPVGRQLDEPERLGPGDARLAVTRSA